MQSDEKKRKRKEGDSGDTKCHSPGCTSAAVGKHGFCKLHRTLGIAPFPSSESGSSAGSSSSTSAATSFSGMDEIRIASFNAQGKNGLYTLESLSKFCKDNNFSVLFILEPPRDLRKGTEEKDSGWKLNVVETGPESIVIIHDSNRIKISDRPETVEFGSLRPAINIQIQAHGSSRNYSITNVHMVYGTGRESEASIGLGQLMKVSAPLGVDVIIGDLNTHGSKLGSSTRSNTAYAICPVGVTTVGGNPLDKVLILQESQHFSTIKPTAGTANPNDSKYQQISGGRKAGAKAKTSMMGKSDHTNAVYVGLPVTPLRTSPGSPSSIFPPPASPLGSPRTPPLAISPARSRSPSPPSSKGSSPESPPLTRPRLSSSSPPSPRGPATGSPPPSPYPYPCPRCGDPCECEK